MKLLNNFLCGVQVASLAEGIVWLEHSGLNRDKALGILKNGTLGNHGKIDVGGNNALDNEKVTNADTLEILATGALLIDLGSSVDNKGGTITVDGTAALTVDDATITGGTITSKSGGTIDLTRSATLAGGGLRAAGELKAGDRIQSWDGHQRRTVAVWSVAATGREAQVFNLVLGEPMLFVADGFLARSKPPALVTDPTQP